MTAPQPSSAPGASADGTDGQAPTGTQPNNTAGTETQQPAKTDLSTLPDDVRQMITDLRAENASHRTGKTKAERASTEHQEKLNKVLGALGLKADGTEDVNADAIADQLKQAQASAWTNGMKLQVFSLANRPGINADASALLDSMSFIDSLDDLTDSDPSSPDFITQLEKKIRDAVTNNPKFKAAPTIGRTGGDTSGGSGEGGERPKTLREAFARKYG